MDFSSFWPFFLRNLVDAAPVPPPISLVAMGMAVAVGILSSFEVMDLYRFLMEEMSLPGSMLLISFHVKARAFMPIMALSSRAVKSVVVCAGAATDAATEAGALTEADFVGEGARDGAGCEQVAAHGRGV